MTPIPDQKMTRFLITVADALDLAAQGKRVRGQLHLLSGRMRALEAINRGEEWGTALADHWQRALDHYHEQYSPASERAAASRDVPVGQGRDRNPERRAGVLPVNTPLEPCIEPQAAAGAFSLPPAPEVEPQPPPKVRWHWPLGRR